MSTTAPLNLTRDYSRPKAQQAIDLCMDFHAISVASLNAQQADEDATFAFEDVAARFNEGSPEYTAALAKMQDANAEMLRTHGVYSAARKQLRLND